VQRNRPEEELAAIGAALKVAPLSFVLGPERKQERATCDGLVERGTLVAVDAEEGNGYRVSDEFIAAMGQRASWN
jgi:hypothetical protein